MLLNGVDCCNWCGTAFFELEGAVLPHSRFFHNRKKGDCLDKYIDDLERKYEKITQSQKSSTP